MTDNQKSLNTCGCCTRPEGPGSESIKNRPGLSALAYRVGTQGQFKAAMKNALSGSKALKGLTVREDDDFSIALLDGWAVTADVLAFYQERIANQGYLRTADERFSLLHLARLIGYDLSPGVAADAYLAFMLEDAPGVLGRALTTTATTEQRTPTPPPLVTIDIGTKAQSIPGPGEQAQIFETIEKIDAQARWNSIKPRLTQPQELSIAMGSIILDGTATDLKKGDTVLIIEDSVSQIAKKVLSVTIDDKAKTTQIDFETPGLSPSSFNEKPLLPPDGKISDFKEKVELEESIVQQIISKTWKGEDLSALIKFQDWSAEELVANIIEQTAPCEPEAGSVSVFRQLVFVFGYNAVKQVTYSNGVPKPASQWQEWALDEEADKLFLDNAYDKIMPNSYVVIQKTDETIESAGVYQITDVDVRARSAYGISSKTTLLTLSPEKQWWDSVEKKSNVSGNLNVKRVEHVNPVSNYPVEVVQDVIDLMTAEAGKTKVVISRSTIDLSAIRDITIYAQSEQLDLAEVPIKNIVQGDTITLDSIYLDLKTGKRVIITGERDDLKGVYASETRMLKEVIIENGFSVITFDKSLTNTYIRNTVTISANIARATHGETVTEILGSGDAGQPFQQFTLRQPPLTYISASTPGGVQTTLEIRVNDLLWKEVPSFYGHGPNERIYITRLDNDGKTHIRFGDGKTGSRLPSGQENVTATYRKGIGLGGLLKADQLSILMTRPFGLKEVTNPIGSSGAADPETLDQARQNTPLTILTLDRVVSLKDFENFTQAFAGIEKARADWVWDGGTRLVYLTVAGANGKTVDEESTLYQNLRDAIESSCNGRQPFRIKSYVSLSFHLKASIWIDHRHIKEKVMTDVKTTLNQVYSFKQRRLAQPVTKSEVMAVIQEIKGIVAVDLDELFLTGEAKILNLFLPARRGRWDRQQNHPVPSELLTLSPDGITLAEMKR
ncbi:MAG: putative baseplate assembly protein [Proteobacteria bacterium]|nr:putative baseplate assembly protein [Pseudomonadota bacterium]